MSSRPAAPSDPVAVALDAVLDRARATSGGAVASYIPELAAADPERLGVALMSVSGRLHEAGDAGVPFSVQSVSKPFAFALAVDRLGLDEVTRHVGVEPSGEPFNAISLEAGSGRPANPLINAGAIVTSALAPGVTGAEKAESLRAGLGAFAGRELTVDDATFESEWETGDRNRALAYLTASAGVLPSGVDAAIEAYFRQCSLLVTARDLACMAATLAAGGVNPRTGVRVVGPDAARWTMAVMTSCGMYDGSGDWLLRVGLPAKSGVGGGIAAVDPGRFGIGTFAPPLDAHGNSVRGIAILERLSAEYGVHVLAHRRQTVSAIEAVSVEGAALVARLRGELDFVEAEDALAQVLERFHDGGHDFLVLDLESVTRLGPAAVRLLRSGADALVRAGLGVEFRDPDALLD